MRNRDTGHSFDLPLGLSMAVAQNPLMFDSFEKLTPKQREELVGLRRHEGLAGAGIPHAPEIRAEQSVEGYYL